MDFLPPLLDIDTKVNSSFSTYSNSEIIMHKKIINSFSPATITIYLAQIPRPLLGGE